MVALKRYIIIIIILYTCIMYGVCHLELESGYDEAVAALIRVDEPVMSQPVLWVIHTNKC